MSTGGLALDDAAWASAWRTRCVRDKAVLSCGLLACAVGLPPWPGGVTAGLVALALLLGPGRVPPALLARSLTAPLTFLLLGAASVLVTVSWEGGPRVGVTTATVGTAAALLVRGVSGTLSVFVLATTTPMVDLFAALRHARVPGACIEVASLTYRLVFVLLDSARTIREAQAARLGYTTRRATMRSAGGLAAAVLIRSWTRAERLEAGLAGRGYTDTLRTLDPPLRASRRFLTVTVLGLAALVALGLLGPRMLS